MELACCDTTFPLLPHEDVCRLVRMLGFDVMDVALWSAYSHHSSELSPSDVPVLGRRLRTRLADYGLRIGDLFAMPDIGFVSLAVNHPDEAERARSRAWFQLIVELAGELGVDGVTTVPGIDFDGVDHDDALRRASEELATRAQQCAAAGLRLSVEPHIGSVIATPADTIRLVHITPGLELTLDYSHFAMQGFDPAELDPVLGRVRHVHARGAEPGRMQTPMARNVIDFDRMIDVLTAAGYAGSVATEYLWAEAPACNDCDTLSETVLMRDRLAARLRTVAAS